MAGYASRDSRSQGNAEHGGRGMSDVLYRTHSRRGRTEAPAMRIPLSAVLAIFLVSATRAADAPPAASPAPAACNLGRIASLDMTMLPDGEIAIPVTVNDQEMKLIVDTGDIYSGIGEESADALHLKRGIAGQMFYFLGNVPAYQYGVAHSLKL